MNSNKTVVITGGSSGIGKECVNTFSNYKYNIALIYNKNETDAKKISEKYNNIDNIVMPIKCDISKEDEVESAFKIIIEKFKTIDVLVNNAAISLDKMICDTTLNDWNHIFSVNMTGTFLCTKEAIKSMVSNKSGKIINISSMWGQVGASCESCYSASKGAVIAFTKSCAKELAPSNICVNCIAPGVIDTPMNSNLTKEDMDYLKEQTPLGKIGTPLDVAKTALFLAENSGDFYTGQVFSINGGFII